MKATIKLYSKSKQTKKVEGSDEKVTTVAERTIFTVIHEIKGNLPMAKKLGKLENFCNRIIGARYKAAITADRKLPATMFYSIELGGRLFRSETALTTANYVNLVKVSQADLKGLAGVEVINKVASIQAKGLRAAVGFLNDVRAIAEESDKWVGESDGSEFMTVFPTGELVESDQVDA